MIWPLALLRRTPVVWHVFLSLHHTLVDDREILGPRHPMARLLFAGEWLAFRIPRWLLMDTNAHRALLTERFGLSRERIGRVFVGFEDKVFPPPAPVGARPDGAPYRVLFYGQFIPFHGLDTIVEAARICGEEDILWRVIGKGQETERFRGLLDAAGPVPRVTWTPWVPYDRLASEIRNADVCLGVFGARDKTSRVIPNKVFQVLAAGRALITADTPAIRRQTSPEVLPHRSSGSGPNRLGGTAATLANSP